MFFVNTSLGKTPYDKSPTSDDLYYQEDLAGQSSGKKEINRNILNSVNNILDSFDDEHILNSMMEDIVKPVIQEAMVREEEQSKEAENEAKRKKEIFTKHEKVSGLYESERYKYRNYHKRKHHDHRQHQPLLVPLYQTRYGERMRRGMARIASSVPWWQNVLQLLAAGLFVFLLPGFQYVG